MNALRVLIGYELAAAMRNRWLLAYGGIFAVLALGLSLIGLNSTGAVGLEGYGRTTASLINLCLTLVPLVALFLGVGITADRETGVLETFLAQPVERNEFLLGRLGGALAGIGLATLVGFGLAGVLIGLATSAGGGLQYLGFLGITLALGAAYLSIGTAIAVVARNRMQATTVALAVWFASVVFFDLLLIAAGAMAGASVRVLTAALLLNPVEIARILALLLLDPSLEVLGPVGGFLVAHLGSFGAAAALGGALLVWMLAPLAAALALFEGREAL